MNFDIWPDSGDSTDPFDDVPADGDEPTLAEDDAVYDTVEDNIDDDSDTPNAANDDSDDDLPDDDTEQTDAHGSDDDLLNDNTDTVEVTEPEIEGTDPHANELADDDTFTPQFPAELDLDPMPQPVDGPPWSDPTLLGDANDTAHTNNTHNPQSPMNDLAAMDGQQTQSWDTLAASQDPAVSSLARWWQP